MSDDFDYKAEKDAEMLMDYHQELAEQEIQDNCYHDGNITVEDVRMRVRIPKGMTGGQIIELHGLDIEAYFVCDKCNLGKWIPVDVDSYIEGLDCQPDDLDN